ncbi:unnamed protein product [Rotaria socialis]|uniref:Proton-coupled folate transporter n=1 Tax=Rotaria socialis TaxID=392032 RepID=A0A817PV83_9BILA|nr:unnamed protein product [Rotaria socialis]CAF3440649.1 unnamed protein product [Rotaria socialis]CAF3581992.1 unnamed protein product [Rotaria socialis]CAF3739235.1 unnamed protein product [Rotaria socialis]
MIRQNEKVNIFFTSKKSAPWWKSISIEPVVFLYMLAVYINIPTDEALLYRQVCYKLYNISLCNSMNTNRINKIDIYKSMEDIIQKHASIYVMYFNFVYSIPSIFISIMCGVWSDKYSHKIPMIFASIGCILSTIVNLFVSVIKYNLSIEILFLSNIFLSLFGSTSTMFSVIYNYISHITTIENRTQRIAIIESCLMFGSTIGLILSGILIDLTNFQYCFLFIIFVHCINIIYITFYVKEVIPTRQNIKSFKNFYETLFFYNDIRDAFRVLFKPREFNQRKYLLLAIFGLLCSICLFENSGESTVIYLYLKKSPLSFSQSLYGIFRGLKSFGLGLGLLFLLPILRYLFNISDMTCAILGTLSKCTTDFLYAMNHSKTFIFMIPLFGMLSSYVVVGIRSYISKICNLDEEGKIFSIIASLESIDALIGSLLFNILYSYTISTYPSSIFILACFLHFLTLPIFIYILFSDNHLNRRKIVAKQMKKTLPIKNKNSNNQSRIHYLSLMHYFRRNHRKFIYDYNRPDNDRNKIKYIR